MPKTKDNVKTSPLSCCQNSDSSTSVAVDNGNVYVTGKGLDLFGTDKINSVETVDNNNILHSIDEIQKNYSFPKRQSIDVNFQNITFTATSWSITKFQKETKQILHGVSGVFNSGDLSVIMGPSGAGKTTLLNILAGFVITGSSGEIKYNDEVRTNNPRFRKLSAYIPQDEELRLGLTVAESMTFAVNLKLGYNVSHEYKKKQVIEILELLGLDACYHTMTSRLSGGQRKRLAVALELLSNPPILFLDEPTTGLDSSSCTQTVSLLKRLAQQGRTVVCTIHQPSALLFNLFDKLYAVSLGKCIYNGSVPDLIPYLSTLGLRCPPYHNPADYLMEVAIGEHGTDVETLAQAVKVAEMKKIDKKSKLLHEKIICENPLRTSYIDEVSLIPTAGIRQFLLLYRRNLLENRRGYVFLFNRILAHIAIGFVFGYLYKGVGQKANTAMGNYVYLYGSMLLLVYTGQMSVMLSFPLEMRVLRREHFNRWYKLSPYLLSVVLIDIPFQVICSCLYIVISYYLTEQPIDFRVYLFIAFATASSLCAQSWGYFIGATASLKIAVFIGPVIACLFSIFGFCLTYINTPIYFKWMYALSYYRAGFHAIVYSIYGLHRNLLQCPEEEVYCHYSNPNKLLEEMDVTDVDLVGNMSLIVAIWGIMHIATFISLWLKLTKR